MYKDIGQADIAEKQGNTTMTEKYTITEATAENASAILQLYRTQLGGPADWNENYPSKETIAFDLFRQALFMMQNEEGNIIAVISIDQDDEVDTLDCWSKTMVPSAELARLCVREEYKNQGISKQMMQYAFERLQERGMKAVHILVRSGHAAALCSYRHLGFQKVGECELFGKHFECMEKEL